MRTLDAASSRRIPSGPRADSGQTWQRATCELIDQLTSRDACFSAGEIAKHLREHLPELRFSITELSEWVKDRFFAGAVEYRDGQRRPSLAYQVPRRATGRGGQGQVFVYAPTPTRGLVHDFDVRVPLAMFSSTAEERRRFAIADARANARLVATVASDRKLFVPRRAFEWLSHATRTAMRSGDPVWFAAVDGGTKLRAFLSPTDGSTCHDLRPERGAARLAGDGLLCSLVPEHRYPITLEGDGLTIDLDPRYARSAMEPSQW